MHILIAPNAFKNSLSAPDVADAIRLGLLQSGLPCHIRCFPIGDGGDGTASLIVKYKSGYYFETQAEDPIGRKIKASIGFIDGGKTAVIEMASVSGIKQLREQERNPMRSSSYGSGELIRIALDKGVRKIIMGIGGSATVDGGCGILQALGVRFLDKSKADLGSFPENGIQLESIDISGLDIRIRETEIILLCDVDNYLLGENGAAAVFGPQKGASKQDILKLEEALRKLQQVSYRQTGTDINSIRHGGAAGGTAAGLHTFLHAQLLPGVEYFLDITSFDDALDEADLLITGEGIIDKQTLGGKGPVGVARRAKKKNIPVIGVAGEIPLEENTEMNLYFDVLLAISHQPEDLQKAIQHTYQNLKRTARQIGNVIKMADGVIRRDFLR